MSLTDSNGGQEMDDDSMQTEPQDLTMKRPLTAVMAAVDVVTDGDLSAHLDEDIVPQKESKLETEDDCEDRQEINVCDSTSGAESPPPTATTAIVDAAQPSTTTPSKTSSTATPQPVIEYVQQLYQWQQYWDQMLQEMQSTDTLDSLKTLLETQFQTTTAAVGTPAAAPPLANCDTELKHLLTKLQFVNELYDGSIEGIRSQISSYQMKDFCKN